MTIQERFEQFHDDNPEILSYLIRFAREAKASGFKKYGIEAIWQRMRWHVSFEVKNRKDDYKFNDHYRSRYARLVMKTAPDLDGFFEIRALRAA